MAKPIYLIGGSQGGVGKTLITMAVIDYLQQRAQPVLLIESDTSNPDVGKAYENCVSSELIDLDDADGWIELVNTCEREPDRSVVINTAARNNVGVSAYGVMLNSTLTELHRSLVTLYRVKEALGIHHNDALWLVLMALEHYQTLYGDIPGRIEETTRGTLYTIQATAEAVIRESASVVQRELAQAVATTAAQVAQDTATTRKWRWMMGGMAVAAMGVLAATGAGYWLGTAMTRAETVSRARQETEAGSWAVTPDGQLAYRWAQTGELQRLARGEDQTLTRDRQ